MSKWGGEPAHSGLVRPPWPTPATRVETIGWGGRPTCLGGYSTPLGRRPLGRLDLPGPVPPLGAYIKGGGGGQPHPEVLAPPSPLYIGPWGCASPGRWDLQGGGGWRPRGEGVALPPKARGKLPPRVPTPRRMGVGQGGRTSPLWAGSPPHFSPWGPPGWVAPPGGPPGPIRWSRYNTGDPETFPMAETTLPIYNSSPPDNSGTPRNVQDLIRDSEQLSDYRILISIQP